ncbi:MAG: DNA polymerase IV [Candidatus Omnitrophota bacterium]|nr:DNA polymerase IV [Candidatus Omnitrophota bacterium]
MILHIDMDAFFASIEQAINPRLKGKPLIVGSRDNKLHTVVCAASYEAKALGISSGMHSAEAFRLCPNLEFVAAEQSKYIWTSEEILKLLADYGLVTEYASIDEFRLDAAKRNNLPELARDIQQKISARFQINASIGIAKNRLLAKLASKLRKPGGVTLLDEGNLPGILANTPVEKLCGIGPAHTQAMHSLNIATCLDLYSKTAGFLESRFGKYGLDLYLGLRANERLEAPEEKSLPKSIGHSYTFPRATANPGFIRGWIRLLSGMVGVRLRQTSLLAQTIHVCLSGPQIGNFSCQRSFSHATNDDAEVFNRALKIIVDLGLQSPKIRSLGITCSRLSQPVYPPLFKEQKRREDLLKAIDRINSRHGERAIFPAIITLSEKL